MARPTKYTQELADEICLKISTSSKGLAFICIELNIAQSSVFKWLIEHTEFSEKYARAREAQADFLADEIIEIADDGSRDTKTIRRGKETIEVEDVEWTNRSKLRVEARKWKASKLKPKKYGDKVDITTDGEKVNNVKVEVISVAAPLASNEKDVKIEE